MKQVNISDFRAHIGQHLDDLTAKTHTDEHGNCIFETIIQIGDIRNDTRALLCKQETFKYYGEQYHILQQYCDSLSAMNLKTLSTLLHAPTLCDAPLVILNSLCTLFEATQNILAVALQQYPYPIFQTLDMLPLCNGQPVFKIPLSLCTITRFLENTYNTIHYDAGPVYLDAILDSLMQKGTLPLTFNHNIIRCDTKYQDILDDAINAVRPLLSGVSTHNNNSAYIKRLEEWYATYISTDIPMYHNGHIWTYQI